MDKKTLSALLACLAIWVIWDMYFFPKKPLSHTNTTVNQTSNQNTSADAQTQTNTDSGLTKNAASETQVMAEKAVEFPEQFFSLENDLIKIEISNKLAAFKKIMLKGYFQDPPKNTQLVDLAEFEKVMGQNQIVFEGSEFAFINNCPWEILKREDQSLSLICAMKNGQILPVKADMLLDTQNFPEKYVRLNYSIQNNSYEVKTNIEMFSANIIKGSFKIVHQFHVKNHLKGDSTNENVLNWGDETGVKRMSAKEEKIEEVITGLKWVGIGSKYFGYALKNNGSFAPSIIYKKDGEHYDVGFTYPLDKLNKSVIKMDTAAFLGPKKIEYINKFDDTADKMVDYGFFSFLAFPMLKLIKILFHFLGNYGLAIIVSTLILRILILPITLKQLSAMKEMKKHEPAMAALREKYKDNKEELNKQMLVFMRQNKVNPFSSCLPVLLQIPIFIAYYSVLSHSVELFHAPFFAWLGDLSEKDPFYILPVLMAVTMYFQTKMMPQSPNMDPVQAKMMLYMMPVMMLVFMFNLPSGLTLYMFVNSIISIVQNLFLYKDKAQGLNPLMLG